MKLENLLRADPNLTHYDYEIYPEVVSLLGVNPATLSYADQRSCLHVFNLQVQIMENVFYAVNLGASGIRINAISSGTIVKTESREFYDAHPELRALYREILPLGRMCTADDIVDAAMFLLSPRASFITGQNIMVDGGLSLVWQESLARRMTALKDLVIVSDKGRSD